MNSEQKRRLERSGWAVGGAADFLELTPEEASFIDVKPALAAGIREVRDNLHVDLKSRIEPRSRG
jgi:hypothetical protein